MFTKIDPDHWAPLLLEKLSPCFNVGEERAMEQFSSHFFSTATLTFLLLSLPMSWSWALALAPLALTLWQEMIRDKHYKDFWKETPEAIDGRTDLLSRGLGAVLPFITLIWN